MWTGRNNIQVAVLGKLAHQGTLREQLLSATSCGELEDESALIPRLNSVGVWGGMKVNQE